jgi:hypothetical protein
MEENDFVLEVIDSEEAAERRTLGEDAESVRELVERAFLIELRKRTNLWSLDSFRNWYEADPFLVEQEITAYRRFEVGSVPIGSVGIGLSVDVGTAFFTERTLAYFFDERADSHERQRRRRMFDELVGRQAGQKGTLLYDNGRARMKCYFEDAPSGATCGSSGRIRVHGETYDSLLQYYRVKYPWLEVAEDTPAVRVSFRGLDRPQFVSAERLRIRIMNDDVPARLSSVDKVGPRERRDMLISFWQRLEPNPLGRVAPGFLPGFWRPERQRITYFPLTELEFGRGELLHKVAGGSLPNTLRMHYRQRLEYLNNAGCYYVPPAVGRTVYCAYPLDRVAEGAAIAIAEELAEHVGRWTKLQFTARIVAYDRIAAAVEQLRRLESAGTVVFILNDEPTAYHDVAFQLPEWRVKRITGHALVRNYKFLKEGDWDRRRRVASLERGATRWQQFVQMNGLAVLQLMDCVPWRANELGPYEAHVAIDVGHDRRYLAVSLLIARAKEKTPSFWVDSTAVPKPDYKHEAINEVMLEEQLLELFRRARGRRFDPVTSLLFLRDGQIYEGESLTVERKVVEGLVAEKFLADGARVEIVEFHKRTLKAIRLWEIEESGDIGNPSEGTAFELSEKIAIVTSTGAATLHQGTAQPFVLVGNGSCRRILDAARASFDSAQLNYSSPGVAQRLPLELKRTDDELAARAAQEVRRIG